MSEQQHNIVMSSVGPHVVSFDAPSHRTSAVNVIARKPGIHPGRAALGVSLVRAAARELIWGLRLVSRDVAEWRARAEQIPDPALRADALEAITRKRGNINGASLFWSLPDRRSRELLSLLVSYEILADYLDCVNERSAVRGIGSGLVLQAALVEALDLSREARGSHLDHLGRDDGGYLNTLVQSCRSSCQRLPSYGRVQPLLVHAAGLSSVLAINHEPDPALRDRALEEWVILQWPELARTDDRPPAAVSSPDVLGWFERAAGASAWLTVLAMLTLAAEPQHTRGLGRDAHDTYETYVSWISTTGAMLDSYTDIQQDMAGGEHSYVGHYESDEAAVERLSEIIARARSQAHSLPGGARHEVILACMVAFYLSKDSVRTPAMRERTRRLKRAGGPMVALLMPVLRLWRTAYGQRSA